MHDSELIIQAKNKGQIYKLLPVHALDGNFSQALINNYAHWLDIDTSFVEWQLLLNP